MDEKHLATEHALYCLNCQAAGERLCEGCGECRKTCQVIHDDSNSGPFEEPT